MFLLLLGSYDHDTKELLYDLQEVIARDYVESSHYAMLLDRLDLYVTGRRRILVEREDGLTLTFYVFAPESAGGPTDLEMIDTIPWSNDVGNSLQNYLVEQGFSEDANGMEKKPVSSEGGLFQFLADLSEINFIIRFKEETRGGEYVELCYLLNAQNSIPKHASSEVFLMKRRGVTLTSMLQPYFEAKLVRLSEFSDFEDLTSQVTSKINNRDLR